MEHAENPGAILDGLADAGVELIVVGGLAAVMQGAAVTTLGVDVVHRRAPDNVRKLLEWLSAHAAYHRFDVADRRLAPTEEELSGTGRVDLQTDLGKLDLLCELGPGEGYEQIVADTVWMTHGSHQVRVISLERLIWVKAAAGRPKDRLSIPILLATLEERRKREEP